MDSPHRKARVRDVIVLCCWARQFSIKSGPPHPGVYMGSQIKFQGSKGGGGGGERKGKKGVVACDKLDIHFRREAVLVVALCYINQKKPRLDEPLENRLLLPNDKPYSKNCKYQTWKYLAVIFNMNKMETSACVVVTQSCHATPFLSLQISCVTRPHNGDYLWDSSLFLPFQQNHPRQ